MPGRPLRDPWPRQGPAQEGGATWQGVEHHRGHAQERQEPAATVPAPGQELGAAGTQGDAEDARRS